MSDQKTKLALIFLTQAAKRHYGDKAGFRKMIRQPDNDMTKKHGVAGWYLRPLHVTPQIIFVEGYIDNCGRWIGCPNPPDAYLIVYNDKVRRFRDYGRALRYCALQVIRQNRGENQ
jgi:hypothetical protein